MNLFERFKEKVKEETGENQEYQTVNFNSGIATTLKCLCKSIEDQFVKKDSEKEKHHKRFNGTIEPLTFSHENDNEIYDTLRGKGHTRDCVMNGMRYRKPCTCHIEAELIKEINKPPKEKPPIGLTPMNIHNKKRIINILSAMQRYAEANLPIKTEWCDELYSLTDTL